MMPDLIGGTGRDGDRLNSHNWRAMQLRRLGLADVVAEIFADHVDWHDLEALLSRGCPVDLALRISR
jgi:hypothetical protein